MAQSLVSTPSFFGDPAVPTSVPTDDQDHAVAGFGAGTIATLVMHPLDLVKVRFQLADNPVPSTPATIKMSGAQPSIASSSQSRLSWQPRPSHTTTSQSMSDASVKASTQSLDAIRASKAKPKFGRAVYQALADAVKVDGWGGLYRGLIPNLVGGAGSWGLYFLFMTGKISMAEAMATGSTDGCRAILTEDWREDDTRWMTACCAQCLRSHTTQSDTHNQLQSNQEAEARRRPKLQDDQQSASARCSRSKYVKLRTMLTNPIWVVKTRVFATAKNDPTAFKGLWDGLSTIYRQEGLRGLYRGSLLALVGVSNGSIQFATYEAIKRRRTDIKQRLYERQGREWRVEDEKLTNTEYILASGGSKFMAIALTYPYQVVRARIQNAPAASAHSPSVSIPSVIRSTYANSGFIGFYKGLGTNALRILPGTCLTFVVYENMVWGFRTLAVRQQGSS